MFNWFNRKPAPIHWPVDMHSHLIPGLDDGVRTPADALMVLRTLRNQGITRFWTTPHIFREYYPNTPAIILDGLAALKDYLHSEGEDYDINAAAEYYLDEDFLQTMKSGGEVLTLKGRYLLFETNTLSEPHILNELIFEAVRRGFEPVLAHPERYDWLMGKLDRLMDLRQRGVLFQVNMLSFLGYYSGQARKMARDMVNEKCIDFIGSDCHHNGQALQLAALEKDKWFRRAVETLPLKNSSL